MSSWIQLCSHTYIQLPLHCQLQQRANRLYNSGVKQLRQSVSIVHKLQGKAVASQGAATRRGCGTAGRYPAQAEAAAAT